MDETVPALVPILGVTTALGLVTFFVVTTTSFIKISVVFFIVRNAEVWTSTGDYCMNGITRAKVLELCTREGIPARGGQDTAA